MSRHDYNESLWETNRWKVIRYRGALASAMRGRRGQRFLLEIRQALEAMPDHRLGTGALVSAEGEVCPIGALGMIRGIDMSRIDPDDPGAVAAAFDVSSKVVAELTYYNDDVWGDVSPEERWRLMCWWVSEQIRSVPQASAV